MPQHDKVNKLFIGENILNEYVQAERANFVIYLSYVPRTPVILMSRIMIASVLMINGHISSQVKLESANILHRPPV